WWCFEKVKCFRQRNTHIPKNIFPIQSMDEIKNPPRFWEECNMDGSRKPLSHLPRRMPRAYLRLGGSRVCPFLKEAKGSVIFFSVQRECFFLLRSSLTCIICFF